MLQKRTTSSKRYSVISLLLVVIWLVLLLLFFSNLDQDNTPIILGVVIPIVLICLLFVMIIFIRRRRSAGRKGMVEARNNDSTSLNDSVIDTSRPVRIENFANHYRIMSADSDFRWDTPSPNFFCHKSFCNSCISEKGGRWLLSKCLIFTLNLIKKILFIYFALSCLGSVKSLRNWNMWDATRHAPQPIYRVTGRKIGLPTFFLTIIRGLSYNQSMMRKDLTISTQIMCR